MPMKQVGILLASYCLSEALDCEVPARHAHTKNVVERRAVFARQALFCPAIRIARLRRSRACAQKSFARNRVWHPPEPKPPHRFALPQIQPLPLVADCPASSV